MKKPRRQRPAPPFITSTLQQDAGRKLRFTAQRTMALAQQLYEGLNVGSQGSVGLITYMRTDSVNVAEAAVREARDYIRDRYGKEYTPDKPRTYRTRSKNAQEAHEAIRPTSIRRTPQEMAAFLDRDQLRLYTLIWERMVASQMADALLEATTVEIDAACAASSDSVFRFRATGSVLKFPGFRALYLEGRDDAGDGDENALPELAAGDGLVNQELQANQHFTQPPPRFTEATLIREMEDKGIGRPSTYAPTIATLVEREYVEREQRRLLPTELGCTVTDLLTEHFADVMDLNFTARMEEDLDSVAQGRAGMGAHAAPVLRPLPRGGGRGGEGVFSVVREVRVAHDHDDGPVRAVPRVHGIPRLPEHAEYAEQRGTSRRRGNRRDLRKVRAAHGHQDGPLRTVPGLHGLQRRG